ncbi:MAG: hypothetical protein ACI8X5_000076 [Planctomycetota bacterium]|jgi:hypothetical protein
MARSKARSGGGGGGRQSKAKSRKPAPVAEVEVVEESGGLTIDDGIPIVTTILLLAGILLVDYVLGTQYDAGKFF